VASEPTSDLGWAGNPQPDQGMVHGGGEAPPAFFSFYFFLSFINVYIFLVFNIYFFNKSDTCHHFIGINVDTNKILQVF